MKQLLKRLFCGHYEWALLRKYMATNIWACTACGKEIEKPSGWRPVHFIR